LTSLEIIDFNENSLHGSIPSELGMLTDLRKLRLSYNMFTGIPTTFGFLTKLSFLHIHGNRISGSDEYITVMSDGSSDGEHPFISDCGDPVDSLEPFQCDGCDMCCNSLEECQEPIKQSFDDFGGWVSALILTAIVIAALGVSGALIMFLVRRNILSPSKTNARNACGEESVYSFVLTNSYAAWLVAFGTIAIQMAIFALFLNASMFNSELSDCKSLSCSVRVLGRSLAILTRISFIRLLQKGYTHGVARKTVSSVATSVILTLKVGLCGPFLFPQVSLRTLPMESSS
jgi:hypothetical protein